jgi:hypothetical protein
MAIKYTNLDPRDEALRDGLCPIEVMLAHMGEGPLFDPPFF